MSYKIAFFLFAIPAFSLEQNKPLSLEHLEASVTYCTSITHERKASWVEKNIYSFFGAKKKTRLANSYFSLLPSDLCHYFLKEWVIATCNNHPHLSGYLKEKIKKNHLASFTTLLQAGIRSTSSDLLGPLSIALLYQRQEFVRLLLKDHQRCTQEKVQDFIIAIYNMDTCCVKLLLDHEDNLTVKKLAYIYAFDSYHQCNSFFEFLSRKKFRTILHMLEDSIEEPATSL